MNLWFINQFYPPAGAPTGKLMRDLAEACVERGHALTVLASTGGYGPESNLPETHDGVHVIRLGSPNRQGNGYGAKLISYVLFYRLVKSFLRNIKVRPDLIVILTTPPLLSSAVERYHRVTGVPYVIWSMDLYPEALAADGMLSADGWVYGRLMRMTQRTRARAAAVVSLGADMSTLLRAHAPGAKIVEIPVWSQLQITDDVLVDARRMRVERGWEDDELILLYSGNMGRAHRAEEWAALARRAHKKALKVRVIMCGTGPGEKEWQGQWPGLFEWMSPVDERDVPAHLLAADVHLISQQPHWTGIVVPSKYQAACALGRPVIFAGSSECAVAEWVREGDTGWVLNPDNEEAVDVLLDQLVQSDIRKNKGAHALTQHRQKFASDAVLSRWLKLIENCDSMS